MHGRMQRDVRNARKNTGSLDDRLDSIDNNISTVATVVAAANTYNLNLTANKNFAIETTDAVAKTIAFTNVPATDNVIVQAVVKLKYTNAVAITHPAGTVWKDATAPVFATTKQYLLLYTSYDNGTTWLASAVGAW